MLFVFRAKTIKNVVIVNEELTAEEWKRRWERERAKNTAMKALIDKYEAELARWRAGGCSDQFFACICRCTFMLTVIIGPFIVQHHHHMICDVHIVL